MRCARDAQRSASDDRIKELVFGRWDATICSIPGNQMFNWLRKPKPEAGEPSTGEALLTLALDTYARAIEDMLRQDSPAGRAMYVVAYDNLRPLGSAMYTVSIQQNEKPCMVEDLIKFFSRELDRKRDEINIRRFSWYFIAALLARLDKLARKDEGIREHGTNAG